MSVNKKVVEAYRALSLENALVIIANKKRLAKSDEKIAEQEETIGELDFLLRRALYHLSFLRGSDDWSQELENFMTSIRYGMCECAVVGEDGNYAMCPNEVGEIAPLMLMCDDCYNSIDRKEDILW